MALTWSNFKFMVHILLDEGEKGMENTKSG